MLVDLLDWGVALGQVGDTTGARTIAAELCERATNGGFMPNSSYMPARQHEAVAWADNFHNLIETSPETYGLTIAQATAFAAVNNALQAAYTTAIAPETRTKITVAAKDTALRNMKVMARNLVSIIQGIDTVTDAQKIALGITVRDNTPTPASRPTQTPHIKVLKVDGRTVRIQLQQDSSTGGMPPEVKGASVYTAISLEKPTQMNQWTHMGHIERTRVTLPFGPSETGDLVWITASWTNARGTGPGCEPISVSLPAGGVLPTEGIQSTNLKIAA